jgi:hypothetical protein
MMGKLYHWHTSGFSWSGENLGLHAWYDSSEMNHSPPDLHISKSPAARVVKLEQGYWHLEIPAQESRGYSLAQLDDHGSLRRSDFLWKPPLTLSLQARVSAEELPGTWGFGLWNDPFSFMLAYNRVVPRFPTLPDATWFFHASPQNYLSLRDDLPANGFLVATFSSKKVFAGLLALVSPALALTVIPGAAQLIRRLLRRLIQQDAALTHTRVTDWHEYLMEWETGQVRFSLDGVDILQTNIVPHAPLSLVIWVDNQYAALPPAGRLKYGTLPNPEPAWMEIKDITLLDHT